MTRLELPQREWTEKTIQDSLFGRAYGRKHRFIMPNVYVLTGESDLISITPAGLVHEYEIKLTVCDYRADRKKAAKHAMLAGRLDPLHDQGRLRIPSYFWYATPKGLLDGEDIPEYAGHLEIHATGTAWEAKPAPQLHRHRLSDRQMEMMHSGLVFRYWREARGMEWL